MGNSLRSCLGCVCPCGALDLIRIVHSNGYIEEVMGPISVAQVLKANPNHILTKPCGSHAMSRRILILSHESILKRGSIYFLTPAYSPSTDQNSLKQETRSSLKKRVPKLQMTPKGKTYPHRLGLNRNKITVVGLWRPHLDSISEDSLGVTSPNIS